MGQLSEWDAIEAEVARIIAESPKPFTVETVAQIDDFLKYLRGRTIVPEVGKGYWSTLRVMWNHTSLGPLEIEVHGDHLEIYRFRENGEGMAATLQSIRKLYRVAGEPFPADLDAELPNA